MQVFGDGLVVQFVLSKGELGFVYFIYWLWGVGVMMGLYVFGGVLGNNYLLVYFNGIFFLINYIFFEMKLLID